MPTQPSRWAKIVVSALITVLTGCSNQIPGKVTADEYVLYSEWTKTHFAKGAPTRLYFSRDTFALDPLSPHGCGDSMHKAGVPWTLIKQLHSLGEARYPLDFYSPGANLRIPWDYKVIDESSVALLKETPYRRIAFSRAAFNYAHNEALFAVSDSCGFDCGKVGAVHAIKKDGAWLFRSAECGWEY
jgi:hypothetical protein